MQKEMRQIGIHSREDLVRYLNSLGILHYLPLNLSQIRRVEYLAIWRSLIR